MLDFVEKIESRNRLATWATRLVTLSFITYINSVALNSLYIVNCYKYESMTVEAMPLPLEEENSDRTDYCSYVHINIIILVLNTSLTLLNLVFCIPYNLN